MSETKKDQASDYGDLIDMVERMSALCVEINSALKKRKEGCTRSQRLILGEYHDQARLIGEIHSLSTTLSARMNEVFRVLYPEFWETGK